MSEDLVFAIFLLLAGTLFFGVGAYLILHQKVYYDPNNPNLTHVEIPIIGKLWTNVPAMALCFLGLYPIFLSSGQMQNRPPAMITFNGQVTLDKEIVPGSTVIIGLTDSSWSEPGRIAETAILSTSILMSPRLGLRTRLTLTRSEAPMWSFPIVRGLIRKSGPSA